MKEASFKQETFTLIIWEEVPEETSLYLIPDSILNNEDREVLKVSHGNYINHTKSTDEQEKALDCLSNAFCREPKYLGEDHPVGSRWAMRFIDYKLEGDALEINKYITKVIRCGFLL